MDLVDLYRKKIMAVKKEDWNFLKRKIYQNKQGKSKGIPKETTVLLVKNLTSYVIKLGESESEELDLCLCVLMQMQVVADFLQLSLF